MLCWMEYIQESVNIFEPGFNVLHNLLPPPDNFNNRRKKTEIGYIGASGTLKEKCRKDYPDAQSFVPKDWLFSTFLENVLDGSIDCDKFKVMKKNVGEHYKEVKNTFERVKSWCGPIEINFSPPKKHKDVKHCQKKAKKSLIPLYVRGLSVAFNFTEKGTVQKSKKGMPKITKEDLCQTFQYYLEKDLVKNVNLEIEKIKVFHEDTDPPDTGAAGIIYAMNQNKKSSPTKKRKFSGKDITELMKKNEQRKMMKKKLNRTLRAVPTTAAANPAKCQC